MHRVINFLLLVVMLTVTAIAEGKASAQITLGGRSVSTSGGGAADFFLVPFAVAAGETADFEYDYSIQVMDDGLPAQRSQTFCTGTHPADCGPGPTGFEVAYATVVAGFRDGRAANPFVDVQESRVTLQTGGDSFADAATRSGTLHVQVSGHPVLAQSDAFLVYAFAVVDSNPMSPIPEPGIYLMLATGLALLAPVVRQSRGRPKSTRSR
jgi:hypothetical protein